MIRTFEARILTWAPESSVEKTILLAAHTDEEFEPLIEGMLEAGPVTCSEPGFLWRTRPTFHGLFVWSGTIEIEDDTFFFDGAWEDPTAVDLWDMAGLDVGFNAMMAV